MASMNTRQLLGLDKTYSVADLKNLYQQNLDTLNTQLQGYLNTPNQTPQLKNAIDYTQKNVDQYKGYLEALSSLPSGAKTIDYVQRRFLQESGRLPSENQAKTVWSAINAEVAKQPVMPSGTAQQALSAAILQPFTTEINKSKAAIEATKNLISPTPQPTGTDPLADSGIQMPNTKSAQETYLENRLKTATEAEEIDALSRELINLREGNSQRAKDEAALKTYDDEQKALLEQERTRLDRESKLDALAASLGGVSPSELAKLRAAFELPDQPKPEDVAQGILSARKGDIESQSAGFETLRNTLSEQFKGARENYGAKGEEALTDYETSAKSVQDQVLSRFLPEIQAKFASMGLETSGGGFSAAAAKFATDLATDTTSDLANKRLALKTTIADQENTDTRALSDLQVQHSEIQRAMEEANKLAREGRLDQQTLGRLQQQIDAFNRNYQSVASKGQDFTDYNQQLGLLKNEQGFQGIQSAYDRREQDLIRDLQSRQFDQNLQFQYAQLAEQKRQYEKSRPTLASSLGNAAVTLGAAYLGGKSGSGGGVSALRQAFTPASASGNPYSSVLGSYLG